LSVPRCNLWEGGLLLTARARGVVPSQAHHAIQIVIALDGCVAICGQHDGWRESRGIVVRPDAEHSFDCNGAPWVMVFVDPESSEGAWLSASLRQPIIVDMTSIPRKEPSMPYVIGIVLSVGVALFARCVGFDRDRAFYPTVMIVIASYYVLFAAISGSVETVVIESVVMALFAAAAVAGFKSSPWIVVVALAGHGAFDAVHGHIIENAGMPVWWPAWCLAYDVGAAAGLGWLLMRADSPRPVAARRGQ
jgi:hypothetical protein